MSTNETKYVTQEVLTYYDSKIKDYVETKLHEPVSKVEQFETRLDNVEQISSVNAANIVSHREEIDDLEASVVTLQNDNKKIYQDIADIRVELENKLDDIDANNFITESDLNKAIDEFVTFDDLKEVNDTISNIDTALEEKADKTELKGLASEEFVLTKIAEAELADKDIDLSAYYTKSEVDSLIPDVTNFVTQEELDNKGYITQHQSLDNYYTKAQTDSAINEAVEGIEIPVVDLTPYAKKTDIPTIPTKISAFENDKGYLTQHQSLDGKADKVHSHKLSEITDYKAPDLSIYAKKSDLDNYDTKSETEQKLSEKANNILFSEDYRVTIPFGDFQSNDTIQNMTLSDIFVRMLGLKLYSPPVTPEGSGEIANDIISNGKTISQLTSSGELIEVPYLYVAFDKETSSNPAESSCFYQIIDTDGKVTESGYQHVTEINTSMYYIIVLPKQLDFNSNLSVKVWDALTSTWADTNVSMTNSLDIIRMHLEDAEMPLPSYDTNDYTLWAMGDEDSLNTCSGEHYRFIINE